MNRARWVAFVLLMTAGFGPGPAPADDGAAIHITGDAVEGLEPFDELMKTLIDEHGIPGASLCIARDGRVVYARGFGFADREVGAAVAPDSLFRIASLSKPITATAVLQLVQQGRLSLSANPFVVLGRGERLHEAGVDPRLGEITIDHLLHHTAGWDREQSFDPMFQYGRISKAMGVSSPPPASAVIDFMITQPLQFDPGERYAYSNFGYCLLGRIIEKTTGRSYEQYMREAVLKPLGITAMRIGRSMPEQQAAKEVRYYDVRNRTGRPVHDRSRTVPRPYVIDHEVMDAHGAWIASAPDLVRFTIALGGPDGGLLNGPSLEAMFRPPPGPPGHNSEGEVKAHFYGCGWMVRPVDENRFNIWHTGHINGTSALLVRRFDGLVWDVLFNCDRSRANGKQAAHLIDPLLHEAAAKVKRWPE